MSQPEFWPAFYQLAETYNELGTTRDERAGEVVALFRIMPPMAQRQLIDSTLLLSVEMKDIYAAMFKAAHASEAPGQWGVSLTQ